MAPTIKQINLTKSASEPFWKAGIRFECQSTGNCCTSRGSHGFVYVTLVDRRRFAKFFKISTLSFTRRYCEKIGDFFHLKNPKADCRFLKDRKCSVYAARPTQCRTWPFWPENMNAKTWNTEVKAFCPGVGKGKLVLASEIETFLEQDPLN